MNYAQEQEKQAFEMARWRENATPDMLRNYETAKNFLESRGMKQDEVIYHIRGIDLTKPVQVVTVEQGQQLFRFEHIGFEKKLNPVGTYFTGPGQSVHGLGIADMGIHKEPQREMDIFITTRDIQVLKTTAATYTYPGKGMNEAGPMLKEAIESVYHVQLKPSTGGFNAAGLMLEGGATQYFVAKGDLNALERFVHRQHAQISNAPTQSIHSEQLAKSISIQELRMKIEEANRRDLDLVHQSQPEQSLSQKR